MAVPIEAIFFDVNGTLRSSQPSSEDRKREKVQRILELAGAQASPDDFAALLTARMQAYRTWARQSATELSEPEIWTDWMLPDYCAADIRKIAPQLHQLWREATGIRTFFPEVKEVLLELFRRGYRLGIVSNTLGALELMSALRDLEISGLFETVVLSSQVGVRKPAPAILLEAARRLQMQPECCAYVGNRHDSDVLVSRSAGFATTVIVQNSHARPEREQSRSGPSAQYYVQNLRDLLGIFAALPERPAAPTYQASFSTMWTRHNFPTLGDFFEATSRLGFAQVELNHQMDSTLLQGVDLHQQAVSSVHEPCPADISTEQLKERDWLVSSTNEQCRKRGVEAIKRSIDLASDLGIPVIVMHAGMVSTDSALEKKLRKLFVEGRQESDEYRRVQSEMVAVRRGLAGQCMQSVQESLHELLAYAGRSGVQLGLENRYHYYDIPNPDEMGQLLTLAEVGELGFVYDVGHAQHLDRLGFYRHEEWLQRFSTRIIEVHLHDVQGVHDHLAPGLGEVDFDMVARYLPKDTIRTLELLPSNTPEQVKAGLKYLAEHGCINSRKG